MRTNAFLWVCLVGLVCLAWAPPAWARVLDSGTGRWVVRDPAGLVDGPNVYAYGGASPLLGSDPSGLVMSKVPCQLDTPGSYCASQCKFRKRDAGFTECLPHELYPGGCCICTGNIRRANPQVMFDEHLQLVTDCVMVHEQTHLDQRCPRSPGQRACNECAAHMAQIQCLQNKMPLCRGNVQCLEMLANNIQMLMPFLEDWCAQCVDPNVGPPQGPAVPVGSTTGYPPGAAGCGAGEDVFIGGGAGCSMSAG